VSGAFPSRPSRLRSERGGGPAVTRRARRLIGALACAVVAASFSCAPHLVQPPSLGPAILEQRYQRALEQRRRAAAAVESEVVLWAQIGERRMPGAEGRLLMAAPAACRLWVGSLFGTALHLGAEGDSLAAYVPARRVGLRLDAAREPIGVRRPGGLAVRALSGTWEPPPAAWNQAAWKDSLLELRWREGADTLVLAVGSAGLPVRAAVLRPGRGEVRALYQGWSYVDGVTWPARIELSDGDGDFRLDLKNTRTQFPARLDRERFAVRIPEEADTLTLDELRRLIERLGAF
jgi:hypothetical protein